jgi:hypothetical protein
MDYELLTDRKASTGGWPVVRSPEDASAQQKDVSENIDAADSGHRLGIWQ